MAQYINDFQQHGRHCNDEYNGWDYAWAPTLDLLSPTPTQSTIHQPMLRYLQSLDAPWANMGQSTVPVFESMATQPFPPMVTYTHRLTSPTNSGPSSDDTHSGWNDELSTPWSSPEPSAAGFSPHMRYAEPIAHSHGGGIGQLDCSRVVSMHDVQQYPDELPEQTRFDIDDEFVHYVPIAEEGYQPRAITTEEQSNGRDMDVESGTSNSTENCSQSPKQHRRRVSTASSVTSPTNSARVTKRPSRRRRTSSSSSRSNSRPNPSSSKSFPCLFVKYGCESMFGTKNEWKRHVFTQHMRTGLWRCDQCDAGEKKPNDFNRKDLFIQHIRRMHPLDVSKISNTKPTGPRSAKKDPEDRQLADIAQRCYQKTRSLPDECGCHFCDHRFSGSTAWEERMEHVGGHMEATKKENQEAADPQTWLRDEALEEYLKREHIIELKGRRYVLA